MLQTGTMGHNHGPSRTALEGDAIYESSFLLALSDPNRGQGTDRTLNSCHFLPPPTTTSIYPTGAECASSQHPISLLVTPLSKMHTGKVLNISQHRREFRLTSAQRYPLLKDNLVRALTQSLIESFCMVSLCPFLDKTYSELVTGLKQMTFIHMSICSPDYTNINRKSPFIYIIVWGNLS